MERRLLLCTLSLTLEGWQLSQSRTQFPPAHPQSPSLVNLAVTGSLKKFVCEPQIPQVSQISIWVPLSATLAGGRVSKFRERETESERAGESLPGAREVGKRGFLLTPQGLSSVLAPGGLGGWEGPTGISSGCIFYGSSLPFIRK